MDEIPALIADLSYEDTIIATPDDPAIFDLYWNEEDVDEEDYVCFVIYYNKHRIMRHLLDKKRITDTVWLGVPNLTIKHILDYDPSNFNGKVQKAFCKVRLHCRKIALVILCVGKLKKDYRDISAIIARVVWGARGYCKMETEIIKIKRF